MFSKFELKSDEAFDDSDTFLCAKMFVLTFSLLTQR